MKYKIIKNHKINFFQIIYDIFRIKYLIVFNKLIFLLNLLNLYKFFIVYIKV
jgi:hypothetical protein